MSIELVSFGFENYKAFQQPWEGEIRPLTLVIGHNNSGKSALIRFPLQLFAGLSGEEDAPLVMDTQGVTFGSSLADLIYQKNPHGQIGLKAGFQVKGSQVDYSWSLQHFAEYNLLIINHYRASIDGRNIIEAKWEGKDPLEDINKYALHYKKGEPLLEQFEFKGLQFFFIDFLVKHQPLLDILLSTTLFKKAIIYLGPFREQPKRYYHYPSALVSQVGNRGERAAALLGHDVLRNKGELLASVSEWFKNNLGGWELDLVKHGDIFSLVLVNPNDPSSSINIADTGTGIAQVLPLVVQRYLKVEKSHFVGLDIIEQPELHLHPGAHGALADLYIEAANQQSRRFLIETHSENFLLRIQRRIAEGTFDHKNVIIYWVDKGTIMPIHIDHRGELDTWPKGVFAEDFEEALRIRKAQQGSKA
ncbi:AAA family ATPase [Acanthopleuribacter pedis]|uniref:AAA family ATPase n=1 Tax=Acanthopleuribacter pedis TaxID=442870 RepID=A0A8J7U7H4_9BACT|nr:AAA family ATPase [Acanthopleuribacter pedis]MBO1321411.1 AAA family ATPase [Acanthopleuribacter pedis]